MPLNDSGANLPNSWTILKILEWTASYFKSSNIDSPRLTAEILLCHCLKISRLELYLQYDRPLDKKELSLYKNLIIRRIKREPVAYITGSKGFWESEFSISRDVLIPRPDTEVLVEACLNILDIKNRKRKKIRILELGSGSGAVIVSLAKRYPSNFYFALDVSFKAALTTKHNAREILDRSQIFTITGSWFSPLKKMESFDLIISNPPYIPSKQIKSLQPEISNYEPRIALDGGESGLESIEHIIDNAWQFLYPDGSLVLETGCDQKKDVKNIAGKHPSYDKVKYIKDYSGHNRVAILRKVDL